MKGTSKVIFIIGKRGSGKTNLGRQLIRRTGSRRILCYDSNGHDYQGGVICQGIETLKNYWRQVNNGPFYIVFRSNQPRADFETVCKLVMAAGDMIFLVDEVDMYFNESEPPEPFADIIRRGRHHDIDLIGITQRPRRMGELRSMAEIIYIFDTHEPSDLQYFKTSFDDKLVEKIKRLKQYEYVLVELPYDNEKILIGKERDGQAFEITANPGSAEVDQSGKPGEPMGLHEMDRDPDSPVT